MNMNGPRFVRAAAQGFIPTFTFDCKQEIFGASCLMVMIMMMEREIKGCLIILSIFLVCRQRLGEEFISLCFCRWKWEDFLN